MQLLLDSISEVPITDIDFRERILTEESMMPQSVTRSLSGFLESIARFIAALLRIRWSCYLVSIASRQIEADGATEHTNSSAELLTKIVDSAQRVLAKVHPSQRREAMTTLYALVVNRCHSTACRMLLERALENHADSFWATLTTNERHFCLNMLEECLREVDHEHTQLTDGIKAMAPQRTHERTHSGASEHR